eukprot:Gb_05135 [translate_table: standard]
MAVPVIDMENLNGFKRDATMAEMANACENWGFFQLLNHGIPHVLLDRVQELCTANYENLFDKEFKKSAPVEMVENAQLSQTDMIKSFCNSDNIIDADWEYGFFLQHSPRKQSSAVPSLPNTFNDTIEEFAEEIKKLAERILELMCENLGLESGYLKKAFAGGRDSPFFGTKVSHYPPCPWPDLIHGLRSHTDAGGIILLFQDDKVPGLQVLKDGAWFDVQPMRHSIVIDIGDQLEVITNGKYKSMWHRVLATQDGNRMSVAAFYNPSSDAMVYPAPQLLLADNSDENINDAEHERYPKFLSSDYMSVYAEQKFLAKTPRFEAMRSQEATKLGSQAPAMLSY